MLIQLRESLGLIKVYSIIGTKFNTARPCKEPMQVKSLRFTEV